MEQASSDPDSTPINASWIRRLCVRAALKVVVRMRHRRRGSVFRLSNRLCVKVGQDVYLAEAWTMRWVAQHTSLPVPKVYCAFVRRGTTYIVMEYLPGEVLCRNWDDRSPQSKATIFKQLRNFVNEMRNLPAAGPQIKSSQGGSVYDPRLPNNRRIGPFPSVRAFHLHLNEGFGNSGTSLGEHVDPLIEWHNQDSWPLPRFTHGDLNSLNILACGDSITGIVDWESAGWWPDYWEYTTACQVNLLFAFWRDEIDNFLEPYPLAQAMETIRQRWFGDF